MNNSIRPGGFSMLPMVVKNLLIINGLFFLATYAFGSAFHIDLVKYLGLHYPGSHDFEVWQFVSYMFMHGGIWHIVFNMFALWMFGSVLENVWGPKRFLNFYLITGIGAALTNVLVTYIRISAVLHDLSPEQIKEVYDNGYQILQSGRQYVDPVMNKLSIMINTPTIGASGAIFGILLAFGMMFPNSLIYIYFAIPVKAKYFVIFYGALELYSGFANNPGDNVAHFAHLGGMVFGFFIIMFWKRQGRLY